MNKEFPAAARGIPDKTPMADMQVFLREALRREDPKAAERLLSRENFYAEMTAADIFLIEAVTYRADIDMAQAALERYGAGPLAPKDRAPMTAANIALFESVRLNDLEGVKTALESYGADPNATNIKNEPVFKEVYSTVGHTAMDIKSDILALLLEKGADPNKSEKLLPVVLFFVNIYSGEKEAANFFDLMIRHGYKITDADLDYVKTQIPSRSLKAIVQETYKNQQNLPVDGVHEPASE